MSASEKAFGCAIFLGVREHLTTVAFQVLATNYKTAVFVISGGEGGIRTLETRYI